MERLRKRSDFLAAGKGPRAPTPAFVLQMLRRGDEDAPRVGLTVSRKVGTATERNRARRRLREMVRLSGADVLQPGHDYVLIARRSALEHPFERLMADLRGAVRRAGRDSGSTGRNSGATGRGGGSSSRESGPSDKRIAR